MIDLDELLLCQVDQVDQVDLGAPRSRRCTEVRGKKAYQAGLRCCLPACFTCHLKPQFQEAKSIKKDTARSPFNFNWEASCLGVILAELCILRLLKCTLTQTMIAFLQMISLWEWLGHVKSMWGRLGIVIVSCKSFSWRLFQGTRWDKHKFLKVFAWGPF